MRTLPCTIPGTKHLRGEESEVSDFSEGEWEIAQAKLQEEERRTGLTIVQRAHVRRQIKAGGVVEPPVFMQRFGKMLTGWGSPTRSRAHPQEARKSRKPLPPASLVLSRLRSLSSHRVAAAAAVYVSARACACQDTLMSARLLNPGLGILHDNMLGLGGAAPPPHDRCSALRALRAAPPQRNLPSKGAAGEVAAPQRRRRRGHPLRKAPAITGSERARTSTDTQASAVGGL